MLGSRFEKPAHGVCKMVVVSPRVSNVAIRQSGSSGMTPTPLAGVLSKPCTPVRVRPTAIPLATFQALAF